MFGNLGRMMKLASELKTKLPELQARLAASEYTDEADGGVVKATVNGKLKLVGLDIAPEVLAEADAGVLEDLIKVAVSAAQDQAIQAAREAMQELTGGMDVPGLTDSL